MSIEPKVSIGLAVYNGEKFLKKRLDSILSQTLETFELIISDNASTDSTSQICKEYAKKDKRIIYERQKKNMGIIWNYNYVLEKAKCKYFVWAAVDDIWLPEFLEENVKVLKDSDRFVGSVGKIKQYGKKRIAKPPRYLKNIRYVSYDSYPKSGKYEDLIRFYLRLVTSENIYAVFRIEQIRKSYVQKPMALGDKATVLNVLKYGEINIINKILMFRYTKGFSVSTPLLERLKQLNEGRIFGVVFSLLPFTLWCLKNLGLKIFFQNLDYFLYLNFTRENLLLKLFARKIQNKIVKNGAPD